MDSETPLDYKEAAQIIQRWPEDDERWQLIMSVLGTHMRDAFDRACSPGATDSQRAYECGSANELRDVVAKLKWLRTLENSNTS